MANGGFTPVLFLLSVVKVQYVQFARNQFPGVVLTVHIDDINLVYFLPIA